MGTSAYLNDETEELARRLEEEGGYDSLSEVVRNSLRELERRLREERLKKKYRREEPVSDEAMRAQAETLSDLDE